MRLKVKAENEGEVISKFKDEGADRYVVVDENMEFEDFKGLSGEEIKKLIFAKNDRNILSKILDARLSYKYEKKDSEGKEIEIPDKNMMFMPNFSKERELLYIFGPSGSGKSFLTRKYVEEYKKGRPDYDVFLISKITDDPSLEGLDFTHIPLTTEVISEIDLSTLADSLIIFDDTDTSKDKELSKLIYSLKDDIAQEGRHYNISAIITTHMALQYSKTRILLNECHKYVIFPKSNGKKQMESMFCTYGGLDKAQFDRVKKLDSRWCMLNTAYPNYIVHEKGAILM